jgi:hypothetical protein
MATSQDLEKRLNRIEVLHIVGGVALLVVIAHFILKK